MKKYDISSGIHKMSLDKRIKSIQLLDYCMMHSWTLYPILAINLAFTWFFILAGNMNGLFGIITLIIFPFLLIIGEFALVLFASFAEICAEMIADSIFPRYTQFPQALLMRHGSPAPAAVTPVGSATESKTDATPQSAYKQANPRYGSTQKPTKPQQNAAKMPPTLNKGVKIDLVERLQRIQNAPENKLCKAIAPAVRMYVDELLDRNITIPDAEKCQLWLLVTRFIAIDQASVIENEGAFITNSINTMKGEMPRVTEGRTTEMMLNEFYHMDAVIRESKAQYKKDYDEVSKDLICALGTFLADWDHADDAETESLLEKAVRKALDDADALL